MEGYTSSSAVLHSVETSLITPRAPPMSLDVALGAFSTCQAGISY